MRRPKARPRALVLLVKVVPRQPVVPERRQAPGVLLEAVREQQAVREQPVVLRARLVVLLRVLLQPERRAALLALVLVWRQRLRRV